jgi:hypothetical protein
MTLFLILLSIDSLCENLQIHSDASINSVFLKIELRNEPIAQVGERHSAESRNSV